MARSSGRGSMLGKTLENLAVVRVPRIEMFAAGTPYRSGQCFFIRVVRTLRAPISPTQHIEGRRTHLPLHDHVAWLRTALAHKGGERTVIAGYPTVRFRTGNARIRRAVSSGSRTLRKNTNQERHCATFESRRNYAAMMSLYFTHNDCDRVDQTLRVTPEVEAGSRSTSVDEGDRRLTLRAERVVVMAKRMPTHIGDVLILLTTQSYTIYGVGPVSREGQQDLGNQTGLTYASDHAAAAAEAKALIAPSRKIFLQNIDAHEWSEISH
jgi:hypothetical protein